MRRRAASGRRRRIHDVPQMQQPRGFARLSSHPDGFEKLPDPWPPGDRSERLCAQHRFARGRSRSQRPVDWQTGGRTQPRDPFHGEYQGHFFDRKADCAGREPLPMGRGSASRRGGNRRRVGGQPEECRDGNVKIDGALFWRRRSRRPGGGGGCSVYRCSEGGPEELIGHSQPPMQVILEISDLSIRRGATSILSDISWRIVRGQHWAILGANGSGKTSLLSALTGYLTPTGGEVVLLGRRYGRFDWRELRKRIGLVSSSLRQMMANDEPALESV